MRFLVDECVHAAIVGWLRAQGHDVLSASEVIAGTTDDEILRRANDEDRVVVTADKDFGDLAVHGRWPCVGLVLLRQRDPSLEARVRRLAAVWPELATRTFGSLVVVSDRNVRIRPLPSAGGQGRCSSPSVRYHPAGRSPISGSRSTPRQSAMRLM